MLPYKAVCLLPLMDMLNHRRDGESNAVVDQNKNGSYSCYAKRDIKAGEEVCELAQTLSLPCPKDEVSWVRLYSCRQSFSFLL